MAGRGEASAQANQPAPEQLWAIYRRIEEIMPFAPTVVYRRYAQLEFPLDAAGERGIFSIEAIERLGAPSESDTVLKRRSLVIGLPDGESFEIGMDDEHGSGSFTEASWSRDYTTM